MAYRMTFVWFAKTVELGLPPPAPIFVRQRKIPGVMAMTIEQIRFCTTGERKRYHGSCLNSCELVSCGSEAVVAMVEVVAMVRGDCRALERRAVE